MINVLIRQHPLVTCLSFHHAVKVAFLIVEDISIFPSLHFQLYACQWSSAFLRQMSLLCAWKFFLATKEQLERFIIKSATASCNLPHCILIRFFCSFLMGKRFKTNYVNLPFSQLFLILADQLCYNQLNFGYILFQRL